MGADLITASLVVRWNAFAALVQTHHRPFLKPAWTDPDIGHPLPSARRTDCLPCATCVGHAGPPMAVPRRGRRHPPEAVSWCRLEGALPASALQSRGTGGC